VRRAARLFAAPLLLFALVSCASAPPDPARYGTIERIGEELTVEARIPLSRVMADPAAHFERTLLVEAKVLAVCQKKGCWMKVGDGDAVAMVRWEAGCGGRYTFPTDAVGARVWIQGSFYEHHVSEEDALHLESEAADGVEIQRDGYEMNASAVLLRYPAGF